MNVIVISVDHINNDSFRQCIFFDVLKDPLPDLVVEERKAALRRPDEMNPDVYPRHIFYLCSGEDTGLPV